MKRFEYDITVHPVEAFQQLVYFCTSDGECEEKPTTRDMTTKLAQLLDGRGQEGWELVHVAISHRGVMTFWKREVL